MRLTSIQLVHPVQFAIRDTPTRFLGEDQGHQAKLEMGIVVAHKPAVGTIGIPMSNVAAFSAAPEEPIQPAAPEEPQNVTPIAKHPKWKANKRRTTPNVAAAHIDTDGRIHVGLVN